MLCKHMARMTVREIRLKWPEAEKKLAAAGEIVVTRDSVPVARILPHERGRRHRRGRFDPTAHSRWLRALWKGKQPQASADQMLRCDRSE